MLHNPNVADLQSGIDDQPSLILTNNQIILLWGWNNQKSCLEMKSNSWEQHSSLKEERRYASAVAMKQGIFLFGARPKAEHQLITDLKGIEFCTKKYNTN